MGVGWNEYVKSLAWRVGNGANINLWEDRWLHGKSLRSLIQGPLPLAESKMKLSTLRSVDISRVTSFDLPDSLVRKIRNVGFSNKEDEIFSTWTDLVKFDSKKASEDIRGSLPVNKNE